MDYVHPENNIFKVVNQYSVQDTHLRRPDLLIFINGIPIGICEFKTAIEKDTTIFEAWEQITICYSRDIPNLMKYCFLSIISDGVNTKMGSIFTPYEYYYSWNKANETDKVSNGISSLFTMIAGAFSKERVVAIIRDFIFYPDYSKKNETIICRYPQFFAANKMLANIKLHMRPQGNGKGGSYFGATGCGKAYTMLFLARLIALRDSEAFQNPTIIIIEDREDLDTQTSKLFVTAKKYLHEKDVRSIEDREDLGVTLRDKPSGGVYITTIQKFCESIGLLSDRNNIICISDEVHRTQTGIGDAEVMNRVVEDMVRDAITCTGIESIVDEKLSIDLFSDEFLKELSTIKMPITKFNALLKLLRKAITAYGKTNKVKAVEFDERLKRVVEAYNSRDKLVFTSEVVADFVNDLSDKLMNIFQDLQEDKISFEKLGITYGEKAFYDILVKVRDDHGFPYADDKCLVLAKKIKELVDDKAQYADWSTRDDIKNQLNMDLTVLLYQNGYPPEWDEEIFEKVMAQAENFKKFSGDSSFNQLNNVVYQFQSEEPLSMVAESVPLYGDKNV